MAAEDPPEITATMHRQLAVFLFNRSWELMLNPDRTPSQDDELLHTVHASAYHWRRYGGTAANLARGENQCARVYAALGRGEPAIHHGGRCLELVEAGGEGLEDWDLASALEVLARAHLANGDPRTASCSSHEGCLQGEMSHWHRQLHRLLARRTPKAVSMPWRD